MELTKHERGESKLSSESNESDNETNRFARLSELDRAGDKESYLDTARGAEFREIGSNVTGVMYPREIHDLQRQEKEEERKDSSLESKRAHNDKPRFYASLVLSILTIGSAIFSLVNMYQVSALGTTMFPVPFSGFVLLFIVSGLLAILFVYSAYTSSLEIRIHRSLKQENK